MLRVTNLRTSGIKTPNFANLFGTAEQAAENWFGSSFRPQRGISLWRKPKKRGIPHSADSVRNDRIVLFPQAVKPCPPQGPFIRWLGSVAILATTMRIRNHKFLEIVVCYEGRRCDGRSRTPAFCSHCSASFPSGASPLPQSFQQAPIHSAAVAGHPLLDALRGLDLSRSRGAARRTSRIASDPGAHQCARFHDAVSFLAALERANHRASRGRDGAPVARRSPKRPTTSPRRRGCDGLGAGSGQHLLCAAPASSRAKTAAVAALAEVGGGGGLGSAVSVGADRATRPVERLREFARGGQNRFPANAHRAGAGRCRIRQREKSHLHSSETGSAKCDPRQARKENLARARSAGRDAAGISATPLSPSGLDREPVQFGKTQALGPRTGSLAAHADPPSPAAGFEFQSVSPEASLPFLEDVNRARWLLDLLG